VENANDDLTVRFERDQVGPVRQPAEEIAGTVHRIDDPAPAAPARLLARLLGQDPVVRERLADAPLNRHICGAIRFADRRVIGFPGHVRRRPEEGQGGVGPGASRDDGDLELALPGHRWLAPRGERGFSMKTLSGSGRYSPNGPRSTKPADR
jgi:hypothetical protein